VTTTVLVPTFHHGPLLRFSVGSALAQTDPDLEVLILGDGVPDSARDVVRDLQDEDERVRFFEHPKGPGHGETYRNPVLREHARGDVVCYLSDDDLWTPDHVQTMRELLRDADFAHALPLWVTPGGAINDFRCDLGIEYFRSLLLGGYNRIPLSCGAHTARAFAQLSVGWQVPPPDSWGDLTFWQQFLADPAARLVSGFKPTVLHFPSPDRSTWTIDERIEELQRWRDVLNRPGWRSDLDAAVLERTVRDADQLEASLAATMKLLSDAEEARAESDHVRAELERVRSELQHASAQRRLYESQLLATWGTLWWQLHVRVARHRVSASAARGVGRAARAMRRVLRR
jgi:hypothetical protein